MANDTRGVERQDGRRYGIQDDAYREQTSLGRADVRGRVDADESERDAQPQRCGNHARNEELSQGVAEDCGTEAEARRGVQ